MGIADKFEKAIMSGDFDQSINFVPTFKDDKSGAEIQQTLEQVIGSLIDTYDDTRPQLKDLLSVVVESAKRGDIQAQSVISSLCSVCAIEFDGQDELTPEEATREDYIGQTENLYIPSFFN